MTIFIFLILKKPRKKELKVGLITMPVRIGNIKVNEFNWSN